MSFKSSVLRLLAIDISSLSWNRRPQLPLASRTAVVSYSSDFRHRRPRAPPPDHDRGEEMGPGREIVPKKNVAEDVEKAKGAALRLLSQRSHSRKELTVKLQEREHPDDAISGALDRLQAVGLQSDSEFADVFTRSKWRQTKWAPTKIKSELTRRGVSAEVSQAAVESIFGSEGLLMRRYIDEELDDVELGSWVPAVAPEGALLQAARRQFQLTMGLSAEARKRRLVGWLQRRGHTWEVVARVCRRLEEEEEEVEQKAKEREDDDE